VSTYNRVVAADENASLAPTVRERLATEMADPTSDVGASLSDTFGAGHGANYPVYYLDIYRDFITGIWVTGQLNVATTLTSAATAGTNTINVASGVNYPNGCILSVDGGTATQQQYKITAGGGTTTLTVTPNIVTTLADGSSINTLWSDQAHLQDWEALGYFMMNALRPDGSDVIQDPGSQPVVLLGNSWYVGAGTKLVDAITAKYPGTTVENKGVNGETSNQILARFDADVPSNSAYVIMDEPGVNDSAHGAFTYRDQSIRNLVALVAKCRATGAIPVFIGPPPLFQYPNTTLQNSLWLRAMLASPTFPDVPATAIPTFQAPSAVPEPTSISIGVQALDRTLAATENIAVGSGAMLNNQSSSGNVAIGPNAMAVVTAGDGSNVAIGRTALYYATTASRNVAVGASALQSPNGVGANATLEGTEIVAVGYQSGASNATDPGDVTAIGSRARAAVSSVAIGQDAQASGVRSIAIGKSVVASGEGSVAIGRDWAYVSASTSVNNEIKLGTNLHTTKIIGRLNVAPRTPTSGADTQGAAGDITSDDNYVYVKTSTGWKRSALTAW